MYNTDRFAGPGSFMPTPSQEHRQRLPPTPNAHASSNLYKQNTSVNRVGGGGGGFAFGGL
jgi:hypothetical protein